MLLAPKFLNYERPEGHEAGHPEVLIRTKLADLSGGVPSVDYDNLANLFLNDGVGLPVDRLPVTSIYYSDKTRVPEKFEGMDRYAFRLGHVLHINAYYDDEKFRGEVDSEVLMERLLRRAAIYSLVRSGKLPRLSTSERLTSALAAGATGLVIGSALASEAGLVGLAGLVSLSSGLALADKRGAHLNKHVEPTVRRLLKAHGHDIVFPNR